MAFFSIAFLCLATFGFLSALITSGGLFLVYRLNGGKRSFFRWLTTWGR